MVRTKIVWICPYSLGDFTNELAINPSLLSKTHPAPWLTYLAKAFEKNLDFELFIISSSPYINKNLLIERNGVNYYFLRRGLPLINKGFPKSMNLLKLLDKKWLFYKVKRLINSINPALVNLHGTEHVLSAVINEISFRKIITIQGFALSQTKTDSLNRGAVVEKVIFENNIDFIIRTNYMKELILKYNPLANFYYHYYPINPYAFECMSSSYDCDVIYAAEISKRKGIEDLIEASVIVKRHFPNLIVKIIGFSKDEYLNHIIEKIKLCKLEKNLIIVGFIQDHNIVIEKIKKSKICVLPTYADTSPGTVAESMALGTPVISYDIDGLPDMIKNDITGFLVRKGDIHGLADKITLLLNSEQKRITLSTKAKEFAENNFSLNLIKYQLVNIYRDILAKDENFELY